MAIRYIGIYVAGGLFIACFMWWLGKYPVAKVAVVSVLVPLALFVLFEVWFLVPLPRPARGGLRLLIASARQAGTPCTGWVDLGNRPASFGVALRRFRQSAR